jgi:NAD(P)-dependent dehydrogenase (short-subunit alcohol dehydrogenase family)
MGGIADITTEQFDQVMKTNLYAMFWLCKKAIAHMEVSPGWGCCSSVCSGWSYRSMGSV